MKVQLITGGLTSMELATLRFARTYGVPISGSTIEAVARTERWSGQHVCTDENARITAMAQNAHAADQVLILPNSHAETEAEWLAALAAKFAGRHCLTIRPGDDWVRYLDDYFFEYWQGRSIRLYVTGGHFDEGLSKAGDMVQQLLRALIDRNSPSGRKPVRG
jgi:hypothetical protein